MTKENPPTATVAVVVDGGAVFIHLAEGAKVEDFGIEFTLFEGGLEATWWDDEAGTRSSSSRFGEERQAVLLGDMAVSFAAFCSREEAEAWATARCK